MPQLCLLSYVSISSLDNAIFVYHFVLKHLTLFADTINFKSSSIALRKCFFHSSDHHIRCSFFLSFSFFLCRNNDRTLCPKEGTTAQERPHVHVLKYWPIHTGIGHYRTDILLCISLGTLKYRHHIDQYFQISVK